MSRTKHDSKGPGTDYWSRRPGTKKMSTPGPAAKRYNTRAERRQMRDLERRPPEADPEEVV